MPVSAASQIDEHDDRVHEIAKAFRFAAGDACAYHLGHAGYLLSLASNGPRLSEWDKAVLLKALEFAKAAALADLPATITREDVLRGIAAFTDQVEFWGQDGAQRAEWGDAAADMSARARIFRNLAQNADLELAIAERAETRRAAILANLRQLGLDVVPPVVKRRGAA